MKAITATDQEIVDIWEDASFATGYERFAKCTESMATCSKCGITWDDLESWEYCPECGSTEYTVK